MQLECLPNEILLEIFDYLHALHLVHAFHQLNFRLNQLLTVSFNSYVLDFRSISKHDFDLLCRQHLPTIVDRVISVHLSADDETPTLPQAFLTTSLPLDRFRHLRALSLYAMESTDLLTEVLGRCRQLTHLRLIQCFCDYKEVQLINQIWGMPKLVDCCIDDLFCKGTCFAELTATSSSIRYLSIKNIICDFRSLAYVFQRTPALTHLATSIICTDKLEKLPGSLPSLTKLTLSYAGSVPTMVNFLQDACHLRSLNITTSYLLLDGDEWQAILVEHLPHLTRFQFKMSFQFPQNYNVDDAADELLATFQTDFWLKKRQCFVRCEWNAADPFNGASLYSLPCPFTEYRFNNELCAKSTLPKQVECHSYDHVKSLQYESSTLNQSVCTSARFPNLSHLAIILPFNDEFLRSISPLHHLKSLDVTLLSNESAYEQLQRLLNLAPQLYLLRFSHLSDLSTALFAMTNASIRRLDFFNKQSMIYSWYFDKDQCHSLASSLLGRQCQTLAIDVQHRSNVLDLIDRMTELRSLTFQCKDDKGYQKLLTTADDELVQWFRQHLPSTCSICRDAHLSSILQMWIR